MRIRIRLAVFIFAIMHGMAAGAENPEVSVGDESCASLALLPEHVPGFNRMVSVCRREAQRGDAFARFHMGLLLIFGFEIQEDFLRGVDWIGRAAAAGYDASTYDSRLVDRLFRNADGVPYPPKEWISDWRAAAERGDPVTQDMLGLMYLVGMAVPQDFRRAFEWIRKGAERGERGAQYHLGVLYSQGLGAPRDDARARKWLEEAAVQGEPGAQYALAMLEAGGHGGELTEDAARRFRLAAMQGHAHAQYRLGLMYRDGRRVGRDWVRAAKWLELAMRLGSPDAKPALDALTRRLTPDQVASARALADAWEPELF